MGPYSTTATVHLHSPSRRPLPGGGFEDVPGIAASAPLEWNESNLHSRPEVVGAPEGTIARSVLVTAGKLNPGVLSLRVTVRWSAGGKATSQILAPFALEPGGTREISFTNMHAAPSIVALLAVGDDSARKGAYEATIELRF